MLAGLAAATAPAPAHATVWAVGDGANGSPASKAVAAMIARGGSQALTPCLGAEYNGRDTRGYRPLALVPFSMGVHVDHPDMPQNSMAEYEKWAADIPVPTYICDDETAIKVVYGKIEVISEGHWKLVPSGTPA